MKTRCLLVDDEPLARNLIKGYLTKLENIEIVGEADNAMKAMEILRNHKVDLMFLDIQMPQVSGLDFLRSMRNPPSVIIISAYKEYALDGFDLDVVDYLLKPVTFERFLKAVDKYYSVHVNPANVEVTGNSTSNDEAFLYVKEGKKVVKMFLKNILFIEGLSEYVKFHTEEKRVVSKMSLTSLTEQLPPEQFLRIHKSFIVSLRHIHSFTANTIEIGEKILPIGRSYKNAVLKALNYHGTIGTI